MLWDIETTQNLVAVFQLKHNDYINPENIIQERYIVCAAWKELHAKTVDAVSTLDDRKRFVRNPHDDHYVVEILHRVLSAADVIIAHNGDQYDIKFTKGRMLVQGLDPLPPIPSIDTLQTARNQFLLNANTLDYLGGILKVGRKRHTEKGLWLEVLKGNKAAIRQMVEYNKGDVELLERVFLKLQPYVANHINRHLFGGEGECPRCGSNHVQSRGIHHALTQTYQRFQCQKCGGWFRSRKGTMGTQKRIL